MSSAENPGTQRPRREPKGGYEPVSVAQLAMVWWAYQTGHIGKLGLRAYFGCIELEVRRRLSAGKYQPSLAELRRLVGGTLGAEGQGGLRSAVNRLLELGLLRSCSQGGVTFALSPDELRLDDRSDLDAMLSQLQGLTRKVPVPRRMVRRLAGGLSKARTAVVIAHLIRCLFYRKAEGINPVGCCKASWIADVFGVTERSVFDARRFLVEELGWLLPRDCTQRVLNRDGLWVSVNLDWGPDEQDATAAPELAAADVADRPAVAAEVDSSGPRPANAGHFSGPDVQDKNPLTGSENQKPASRPAASGGPAGVQGWKSDSDSDSEPAEPTPTLGNIVPEDLRQTPRLLALHEDAVGQRLLTSSEADRLKFLAGAAHAQAVGAKPCRLFAWMVRGRRWEYITQADEDAARARLRELRAIPREMAPARPVVMQPPPPSEDALLVRSVRAALGRAGYRGDPFPAFRREKPEWTRERWDRAVAELDGAAKVSKGSSGESAICGVGSVLGHLGALVGSGSVRSTSSVGE